MAPAKFGLFKARSRDHQEQPSTENLLQSSNSSDQVNAAYSPVPSTSKGNPEDLVPTDLSILSLEDQQFELLDTPPRRLSDCALDESLMSYQPLKNQNSPDATSTFTLHDEDFDQIQNFKDLEDTTVANDSDQDGASTSCDANSLQFDETSLAASEDQSVHCGALKKQKKSRSKEEKLLRDFGMWQASNVQVMENLLSRSCTLDEQIKWEAIATARGLCTLTDSCACADCRRAKYLAGVAGVSDGDGGLGAAPLFGAISFGCQIQ